jgi:dTDP-4-amino-4,6-dideoxygalactose transaminase
MLRVFLPHLPRWNEARRDAAARYAELGLGDMVELPVDDLGHVYHMFVVRSSRRAEIAAALGEAGIACASYYTTPLHLQPAMRYLGVPEGSLPETERAAAENLAVPMWGGITLEQQERVVEAVRSAVGVPA